MVDPQKIAVDAASTALQEFFPLLGIDPLNPQKDVARLLAARALLEDPLFAEDIAFVRRLRGTTERVAEQGIKTFVSIIVTGFLGVVLLGTKEWWLKHIIG
jgi:hypothetical protein